MINEEKVLSMLETLVTNVNGIEEMFVTLDNKVDNLGNKVDSLGNKVDNLGNKVDSHENKFDRLEIKIDNLENKLYNLECKFNNLENEMDNLEHEMLVVKDSTLRIENEHGKKLDALFDSYIQLYGISKDVRTDITLLQASQDKQELHIKWHDSLLKAE